jgi:hypothetical protein
MIKNLTYLKISAFKTLIYGLLGFVSLLLLGLFPENELNVFMFFIPLTALISLFIAVIHSGPVKLVLKEFTKTLNLKKSIEIVLKNWEIEHKEKELKEKELKEKESKERRKQERHKQGRKNRKSNENSLSSSGDSFYYGIGSFSDHNDNDSSSGSSSGSDFGDFGGFD